MHGGSTLECLVGLHSLQRTSENCAIGCAIQAEFIRIPNVIGGKCIMKSPSEFRAGASFCRPTSGCKHVVGAEIDNPCALVHVLPVSSSLVCPKFLGPHRGLSCRCFPSLVERRELCRCRSGSADVAGLAPCPICFPSLPARYALGVGERSGGWPASRWHTIPPLRVRPHQQLALSSSALPHEPISQVLSCEAP